MSGIFGADGIRGKIDVSPLTSSDIERIGQAVGIWFLERERNPTLLIGSDTRESGQRVRTTLAYGLNRVGVHTINGGILTTPSVSYTLGSMGYFVGGIVVSASHNPIEENGIKIMLGNGVKLDDEMEAQINYIYRTNPVITRAYMPGKHVDAFYFGEQYAKSLVDEFKETDWSRINLLLDCANGAAYEIAPLVFSLLGIRHRIYNAWPDGTNINRQAGSEFARLDPKGMAAVLRAYNLPYGLALDGDADRAVFVDADGHFYDGDILLAMLALKFRRVLTGNKVVVTPMSNSGLDEYLNTMKIVVEKVQNGDKHVTHALLAQNLLLGGEQIGHVIIHNHMSRVTGDGIRTALAVLSELAHNPGMRLYDLAEGMHKWPQINVSICLPKRVQVQKEDIPGLMDKVVQIQERWCDVNVRTCRPASTEPCYRLMLEARFTPVNVLAGFSREMAGIIQRHFGCEQGEVIVLDLTHGGRI